MYVDTTTSKRGNKTYHCHMLRTSYRENGKVKHKTLCNLSDCTEEEIAAIKLALKHKKNLGGFVSLADVEITLGKRLGAVWTAKAIAERSGLSSALGTSRSAKLALLQVIARLVEQGSRLSAVRFAQSHAVCELLEIKKLDEDDLYENLDWLEKNQERIEKALYRRRFPETPPTLFLYDVTSSYLEGNCNELAEWGYNRDQKRGKKQIVLGMLADPKGLPVAVRVFRGNTVDTKTVSEQVQLLAKSFAVKEVTLVGDRGMLKGPQIEALPNDFRYISAISKPQIRKMLDADLLQLELFDSEVCEIQETLEEEKECPETAEVIKTEQTIRYILRKNPVRAEEMAKTRRVKGETIKRYVEERTHYLAEHKRASVEVALKNVAAKIQRLKAEKWLTASAEGRIISVDEDAEALEKAALLDGCYVIKSDVPSEKADARTLHDRYCDLEMVERSFRTMKSSHLELRPIFVRKKESTRGHVLVVMLALLLQRELESCWSALDTTVKEGLDELGVICMQQVKLGKTSVQDIPTLNERGRHLLESAKVILPTVLPTRTANVHTKKKLKKQTIC